MTTDHGRRTTDHGPRTTDDGRRTTDHGRRTTATATTPAAKIQELESRTDQIKFYCENTNRFQKLASAEFDQVMQMLIDDQKKLEEKSPKASTDRTRYLRESILPEKQPDYETAGKSLAHEKENEILEQARKHYNQVNSEYRRHR